MRTIVVACVRLHGPPDHRAFFPVALSFVLAVPAFLLFPHLAKAGYGYPVLLLPVAVVALVIAHVLLVRRHGVVAPFDLEARRRALTGTDEAPATSDAGGGTR